MDESTLKLIASGGLAGGLLALMWVVGNRLVAAIDRLGIKVDSHTERDIDHHIQVKTAVISLQSRLDGILDQQERQDGVLRRRSNNSPKDET